MAAYDVELSSLPPHVLTADVADALNLGFDETAMMLGELPVTVAERVDELDAEAIFHALRDLGAEVRLSPVAGPPSQRPSARPGERRPSFRPAVVPAPQRALPAHDLGTGPALGAAATASAHEPIDLPGLDEPLELELDDDRGPGSFYPPASYSEPPASGVTPAYPPSQAPASSVPPRSGPPSQPAGPPASRPPSSAPRSVAPPEEPLGEARGSFVGALPGAYAYAFNPGVMLQGVLTALFASFIYGLGFGLLSLFSALIAQGVIAVFLFAIISRASMGKKGAPAPAEAVGADELVSATFRVFLAFFVPLLVLAWLSAGLADLGRFTGVITSLSDMTPLVKAVGALWLLYLPSSLILAAHGTGCLGGLNLIAGVKLVTRAPIGYAILWVALLPVVGLLAGCILLGGLASVALPIGGTFVTMALCMFPLAMGARLLGLYMYHYEYELGFA